MNRIIIVGYTVIDTRSASVSVVAIIIRHSLPFPFSRQSPAVIACKRCGPIPIDISYRVILKAGINRERTACPVNPRCSAIGGSVSLQTEQTAVRRRVL